MLLLDIKIKFYYDYGQYFLLLSLLLSLTVHIPGVGVTINGATRWINLGFFTLQVSEGIKIIILYMVIWIYCKK
jgi:cell division protein FtsW